MSDVIIPIFTLGDRLAKARDAAGIGVLDMANRLGVSRNTIGNWEHDRVPATRAVTIAYASVTGVPVWWLLGEEPGQGGGDRRATPRSTKWEATPSPLKLAA